MEKNLDAKSRVKFSYKDTFRLKNSFDRRNVLCC